MLLVDLTALNQFLVTQILNDSTSMDCSVELVVEYILKVLIRKEVIHKALEVIHKVLEVIQMLSMVLMDQFGDRFHQIFMETILDLVEDSIQETLVISVEI